MPLAMMAPMRVTCTGSTRGSPPVKRPEKLKLQLVTATRTVLLHPAARRARVILHAATHCPA